MLKHKNFINISFLLFLMLLSFFGIKSKLVLHPDTVIIGNWEEESWQYSKANEYNKKDTLNNFLIDEVLKEKISKRLNIHKSEEWIFKKNTVLIIRKKNMNDVTATWKLKGRGHILAISYNDSSTELYRILELTKNNLVLSFENDVHVRGIVKIQLKKIDK